MRQEIKRRINDVGAYSLHDGERLIYVGKDLGVRENIAGLTTEALKVVEDLGETIFCFLAGRGFEESFMPLFEVGSSAIYPTTVAQFIVNSYADIPARFQLLYSLLSGNTSEENEDVENSSALMFAVFLVHFKLSLEEIHEVLNIITCFTEVTKNKDESLSDYIVRLGEKSSLVNKK